MKYIDFEPLGNTITISFKIKELERLAELSNDDELKTLLKKAKEEKQEYENYAKENEWMSLRLGVTHSSLF